MCPLRGSFMCLVRHFSTSAMSFQLHHQAALKIRLCWREFLGAFHLCCNQFHALQRIFSKLRVSFQSHLVILHVNLDCSIQDLQLLHISCRKTNVPGLFHPKPFLQDMPKVVQLFPSCHHAEVVSMAQSFEVSVCTAKDSGARGSDLHGTILQHF